MIKMGDSPIRFYKKLRNLLNFPLKKSTRLPNLLFLMEKKFNIKVIGKNYSIF